jgi:Lrp/AsnC family transcriptional regulator, leucine-responsive regulatory protein
MSMNQRSQLDSTDGAIIALLQSDGRLSNAELAREVSMSASAVADRVRRLVDLRVIRGYTAVVNCAAVGLPLVAFIRLRLSSHAAKSFDDMLATTPEILEAHHLTGDDCFLIKVVARSMEHLEETAARFATYGHVTTNVVFSSPVLHRPVPLADA